jgi:DNA-binding MarR family transcriptional regulator
MMLAGTDHGLAGTDHGLAGRLRLSIVRLNRRLRYQQTGADVSLNQLSALATLRHHGPLTAAGLAEIERVAPSSMSRVITSLRRAGLASRRTESADRRRSILRITPAGVALLAAENTARERWLMQRLSELPERERGVLLDAVDLVNRIAASER